MQLIPAKCPDCGADIKIPEGSTQLVCEFCGGNILVTDLLGSTSVMQNCMTLAYSAMESGNYKDAYDHFNRAIEIDMKNPNAWFGKAVCTGMTGKFSDDVFGKMINLFENAFNYAAADKQSSLKKNAAAEIVKVFRKTSKMILFAIELNSFKVDYEYTKTINDEISKLKETVIKTVQKAQEYDPANKDVSTLMDEITSGKFFETEKDNKIKSKDDSGLSDFKNAAEKLNAIPPINSNPAPVSQTDSIKKGGCSMVLIILILVMASTGLLLGLFHL